MAILEMVHLKDAQHDAGSKDYHMLAAPLERMEEVLDSHVACELAVVQAVAK